MNVNYVYQHFNPVRVVFCPGALKRLPSLIGPVTKPLVVSDKGIAVSALNQR